MTYLTVPINTNELTMSSIELLEIINAARLDQGETAIRRNDFSARVADELDGDYYESFVVENSNGTKTTVYRISRDQCTLVSMRESKAVRRSVLEKLKATEKKATLPANYIQALEALVESEKQKQLAIATKAEIGSRREATAMSTASTATRRASKLERDLDRSKEYCTIKRMSRLTHGQAFNWRLLKSAAQDIGIPSIDIHDANSGTVKAYHADVWMEAYQLEVA